MTVNIEKMRFDIEESRRQSELAADRRAEDLKWETRKFTVQIVAGFGAAFAGGAAILGLILHWIGKL